jgi:hypothetical protein
MTPCRRDALFLLVEGALPAEEEPPLRTHLALCPQCRADLALARSMHDDARALHVSRVDPEMRDRLWQALQPMALAAAAEQKQRAAWTLVLGDRRLRRTLAVAAVLAVTVTAAWQMRLHPGQAVEVPASQEVSVAPPDLREPLVVATGLPQPVRVVQAALNVVEQADPEAPPTLVPPTGEPPPSEPAKEPPLAHNHAHVHGNPTDGLVRLACGGVVEVGSARVEILRNVTHAAELTVSEGRIGLHVPRLPPGGSLVVRTDDVAVHVKGTRFSVDKQDAESTEVRVQEGTVWVEPRGRGREWRVLHAGDVLRIAGERSWLRDLMTELDDAIGAGHLDEAQELAQRYLEAAQDGSDADEVRLRLAGIYLRLGKADDAARLFRAVAEGQGLAGARDNALAMLAWTCRQRGRGELELATWLQYLDRFGQGLHAREAMLRLVELTCGQGDEVAIRVRQELEVRFGHEASAQDVLARCSPKAVR